MIQSGEPPSRAKRIEPSVGGDGCRGAGRAGRIAGSGRRRRKVVLHFGQRAFQAPSSKNLKSSCGDGRNNTSDVWTWPVARWPREVARSDRRAKKKRLARGEGQFGIHRPLERGRSGVWSPVPAPDRLRCDCAAAADSELIDQVLPQPERGMPTSGTAPVEDRARNRYQTPTQDRGGSCMSRTEWLGEPAIVLGVKSRGPDEPSDLA